VPPGCVVDREIGHCLILDGSGSRKPRDESDTAKRGNPCSLEHRPEKAVVGKDRIAGAFRKLEDFGISHGNSVMWLVPVNSDGWPRMQAASEALHRLRYFARTRGFFRRHLAKNDLVELGTPANLPDYFLSVG
jgi:hypothetical protein